MAKVRLNTGGKILIVVVALALIGVAIWQFAIPKKSDRPDGPDPLEMTTIGQGGVGEGGGAAAAGVGESTPGLGRPIKVAIVTWGGYAGGIWANRGFKASKESLFWTKYGVEVDLRVIDDYPASRDSFKVGGDKEGGVDIMWGTVDAYALEYDAIKDLNPVAFMQYDWSRGGDAIAVTKEIRSVSDLKGKQIAVAKETPSHYFALYLLSQANMKTSDVNFVFTNSAVEAAQIFKQGKVDAAVSWSPDVYQAAEARAGGHILASTKEASSLIADIFIARGDFAKEHPELLGKFMLGWFEGVDAVNKDPKIVYQYMADGFEGVGLEDAEAMIQDVKLPSYAENLRFFEATGNDELRGYADIFSEASKLWRALGTISGRTDAKQTYDARYLLGIKDEAVKALGPIEQASAATKEFAFKFDDEQKKAAVAEAESILTRRISIFFPTGEHAVGSNAKYILDEAAALAQTFGTAQMRVVGNTDTVGNRAANVALSKKRAQAVVDYMIEQHGFPRDKFVVIGAGPDRPVAPNTTEEGREQNRRTDFEIVKIEG